MKKNHYTELELTRQAKEIAFDKVDALILQGVSLNYALTLAARHFGANREKLAALWNDERGPEAAC